jgi:NADH:ubiquinone oxidoreductase subunit 5 (subunit L)/multisubunit Na+/H+ antiporter MnhA subunit
VAFFGPPSTEKAEHAHEPGWSMRAPIVVLAALSIGAGVLTAPFARLHGEPYHFHMGTGPAIASALGIGGFALAYVVYGRARRETVPAAIEWIDRVARTRAVNRVYELGFRNVTLVLADGLAWVDRYVVDGVINMLGYGTLEAGRRARPIQTGLVPDYVLAVVVGVVSLAAWAVWR